MGEEELVFLLSVTVIMPLVALWIILSYQKARLKAKGKDADTSLTTSELSAMIDESVQEATESLNERIAKLEEQMQLIEPGRSASIQDELSESEGEESPAQTPAKTLGKTRS